MTAKGSTPIRRGSGLLDAAGSGGASTPKASTPVAPRVASLAGYELEASDAKLSAYVGQTVAVTGTSDGPSNASKLTVASVRLMSSGCSEMATR